MLRCIHCGTDQDVSLRTIYEPGYDNVYEKDTGEKEAVCSLCRYSDSAERKFIHIVRTIVQQELKRLIPLTPFR